MIKTDAEHLLTVCEHGHEDDELDDELDPDLDGLDAAGGPPRAKHVHALRPGEVMVEARHDSQAAKWLPCCRGRRSGRPRAVHKRDLEAAPVSLDFEDPQAAGAKTKR